MYYREVPEISNNSWKYELFKNLNPLEKLINIFYEFFGTNIYSTKRRFYIKPIHSTAYLFELVLRTNFIWVYIIIYVDNGTAKVPFSDEIGVRLQGPTSKIWNYPLEYIPGL